MTKLLGKSIVILLVLLHMNLIIYKRKDFLNSNYFLKKINSNYFFKKINSNYFLQEFYIKIYHNKKKRKQFSFNKQWDFLDYSQITDYDSYRNQRMTNEYKNSKLNVWKDKIWLIKWYKKNNIPGPDYINYTQSDDDIIKNINLNSYCIKPSHLSERVGVFVFKDNVLIKDVEYKRIKNVTVPSYFKKFKIGYKINTQEIYNAMMFLKSVRATWEEKIFLNVKPGYIIEKLHDRTEIKVFVMLGNVIGYYYMISGLGRLGEPGVEGKMFNLYKVFKLAEKTAICSGIDFVRIDIVFSNNEYRVSEFTFNPALWGIELKFVKKNFHKILTFHKELE